MARLAEKYREEVFPQIRKEFGLENPMQVPRIEKVTCNIGIGEASRNAKLLDTAMEQLSNITGQRPVMRKARKSIAQFKLREVDLKADHDARVAGAETEYQKKLMSLFMNPGAEMTDQAVEQMLAGEPAAGKNPCDPHPERQAPANGPGGRPYPGWQTAGERAGGGIAPAGFRPQRSTRQPGP
mgnify:CR=1 FL=1